MQLLSAQQIHDWDAYTIIHEPISSTDLMERAAAQCTRFIVENNWHKKNVTIFCGKGNNGGDGLAIARQLLRINATVSVYILEFGARGTNNFQTNLVRLHEVSSEIHFIQSPEFLPVIEKDNVVIDCLYGSGLNRPLQGLSAETVQHINHSGAMVIAIDVPSGMYVNKSSKNNVIIKAHHTLTFQVLKLCFLVAGNEPFFGKVTLLPIGLHQDYLKNIKSTFQLISFPLIEGFYKLREPFSHKGSFGHALMFAGNEGKMGAALLASKAVLRAGAALVSLFIHKNHFNSVHTFLPEAMCLSREMPLDDNGKHTAAAIGPGLGTNKDISELVIRFIKNWIKPLVVDADALNILSSQNDGLNLLHEYTVITPHPKEFDRLFGSHEDDFDRINTAINKSTEFPFVIVLKGHHTLIACKGNGWINNTGNAGLAKGGSGDVLTGIIAGLLCQGYNVLEAAIFGVFLHGLAADVCLDNESVESMLATDVIDCLGDAFKKIPAMFAK